MGGGRRRWGAELASRIETRSSELDPRVGFVCLFRMSGRREVGDTPPGESLQESPENPPGSIEIVTTPTANTWQENENQETLSHLEYFYKNPEKKSCRIAPATEDRRGK